MLTLFKHVCTLISSRFACHSLSPSENITMLPNKLEWFSRHADAKTYSSLIWKVYIPGKRLESFIEDNNIQQMEHLWWVISLHTEGDKMAWRTANAYHWLVKVGELSIIANASTIGTGMLQGMLLNGENYIGWFGSLNLLALAEPFIHCLGTLLHGYSVWKWS